MRPPVMVATGKPIPGTLAGRTLSLEEARGVLSSMENFGTFGIPVIDRY